MTPAATCRPRLDRFHPAQLRLLQAAAGLGPLPPFADEHTRLRALPPRPAPALDGLRIVYRHGEDEHMGFVLSLPDLAALGIAGCIVDGVAPQAVLAMLAPQLERSLQRAGALLGRELLPHASRLADGAPLRPLPWRFVAEGVPRLGALALAHSTALLGACLATPASVHSRSVASHVVIGWTLALPPVALAPSELHGIEPGDVVRVAAPRAGIRCFAGRLLPRGMGAGTLPSPSFEAQAVIDEAGWLALQLQPADTTMLPMEDPLPLDAMTVPVEPQLPLIAMSLAEIGAVRPGTLVDTGVRLDDVEVTLCSAGRPFAVGRLVMVGDDLGVEVLRVAGGGR